MKKPAQLITPDNTSKLIKIGEASKLLGISIDTLRRWEREGWLKTFKTPGGTRLYDKVQLQKLNPNLKKGPKSFVSPLLKTLIPINVVDTTVPKDDNQSYQTQSISLSSDQSILKTMTSVSQESLEASQPEITSNGLLFPNEFSLFKTFRQTFLTPILVMIAFSAFFLPAVLVSNYFKENQYLSIRLADNKFAVASDLTQKLADIFSPDVSRLIFGPAPENIGSNAPPDTLSEKLNSKLNPAQERDLGYLNSPLRPAYERQGGNNIGQVLAESTSSGSFLQVNLNTEINGTASVSGTLTAPNILYSLVPGNNITITGDTQRPTISSTVALTPATNTALGVASFSSSFFTVNAGAVSITSGSITNSSLSSSKITINTSGDLTGGGDVSLGGSIDLAVTAAAAGVTSITGTSSQVVASASTGAVTLSLPQSIATTSTPAFASVGVTGSTSGTLTLDTAAATTSYTLTFPATGGTSGYVLTTDGSGTTSWSASSGGSGTTNTIAKFTSATNVGDSLLTDDGTTFAINTNKFTVTEASGNTSIAGTLGVTSTLTASNGFTQTSGAFSTTLTTTNSATFSSTTANTDTIAIKPQVTTTTASFTGTLTSADLTGTHTWTLPNADGIFAVSATSPVTLSAAGDIGCSTCVVSGGSLWTAGATSGTTTQTVSQGGTLTFTAGTDITTTGSAGVITIADSSTLATVTGRGATTTTLVNLDGGIAVDTSNFTVSGTTGAISTVSTLNVDSSSTLNAVTIDANANFAMSSGTGTFTQNSTATGGGDFSIVNTGVATAGTIAALTANSLTSGDVLTISATAASSGSLAVLTGPSGGTAGVTDAALKITSDVGNIGTSNGLINSTATFDGSAATGVNLYLTSSDAIASANTDYGIYNTVSNTGALNAASTKTTYGNYISASSTGATTNASVATTVYGQYITTTATHASDNGTVNNYGLYVANGTSSTNGTSTKYGINIDDQSGADTNIDLNFTGSPIVRIGDAGVLTFTEAGGNNTLCTLTDNANKGDLTCTGNITGSSSGTVGFWTRTSTTLSPATGNDIVSIANTTTTGADLAVTNTGIYTGTGLVNITANSATSGDILTISATAATSGSLAVLTGPSGGTAGVTDAALKIASDVGNIGTSNGLISSTATIDSTANAISGVNLYLSTASSQALATTVGQDYYGIYNTLAKTGADTTSGTINSYGVYSTVSNTGGDTAGTRSTYGGYFSATADASGTTNAYGLYAAATGGDNNYGLYINSATGTGISIANTGMTTDISLQNAETIDNNVDGTINLAVSATSALKIGSTGISSIGNVAHTIVDSSGALAIDSATTGAINIGTGANAKTITVGNNTTTSALAFTSGTGSQTHTSSVATTGTTSSAFVFTDAALTSGTLDYLTSSSVTTGKLLDIATTGNTWTGNSTTSGLVNLASTSTAGTVSDSDILLKIARSGANASNAHTAYGIYSTVTNTNVTSGTNIAGYFSSTGATTANYGLQVAALTGATSYGLDIGALSGATANRGIQIGTITSAATANNFGIDIGQITSQASATSASINTSGFAAGAGTATYGIKLGTNASTATTNTGLDIGAISGAGTTNFGINIGAVSGASTNVDINLSTSASKIRIADTGSVAFTESGGNNTLCTITDASNLGNLSCTGTITGVGAVGYWTKVSTTLSPATASDSVNIGNAGDFLAGQTTGKIGVGGTVSGSDFLTTITADSTQDWSEVIDITQSNNALEDTIAINLNNTATPGAGTMSDGNLHYLYNIYSQITPGVTNISSGSELRPIGIYSSIDLSNITLGDGGDLSTNEAEKLNISGTPIFNSASNADFSYSVGSYITVSTPPTLTAVTAGSDLTSNGLRADVSTASAGNANLSASNVAIRLSSTGNLTTTGTTLHKGIDITSVSGTADNNYGLNIASISGATNNYGLYINTVAAAAGNWSIYSNAAAQSYFAGNVGIGTDTTPDNLFEVENSAALTTDLVSLVASGATTASGIDALSIAFTTGDGASVTNSGIDLTVTPGGTAAGDIVNGININNLTSTSSTETALNIGTGWDTGVSVGNQSSATSIGVSLGNFTGATANTGISIGTLGTATTSKGVVIGANSSATATGVDIGALSGATANIGVKVGAISGAGTGTGVDIGAFTNTGATQYGVNIGAFSGTHNGGTTAGVNIGNISSVGTTTVNYGLQLGTMTGGTTSNYQIQTGNITSIASATNAGLVIGTTKATTGTAASSTNYGINIFLMDSTGTINTGLNIGALSGATTTKGVAIGALSGATSTGVDIGNLSGATTNTGILIGTLGTATTSIGVSIGALSSATSTGVDIGAFTGATTNTGINITSFATGTTSKGIVLGTNSSATATGIDIGALSGATANIGVKVGAISGAGTGTGVDIGAFTNTGATQYGVNIGAFSGTHNGGTTAGINIGNISSVGTTTNNYGIQLGTLTGGTTANYQISTGAVTAISSATNAQINLAGVTGTAASSNNYGINIGNLDSTGTTNNGIKIGTLSGATTSTGFAVGAISSATSTGLTIGALSGTTTNIGVQIGPISGSGANGTSIATGNISSTGTANAGLSFGTLTGGTATNYQITTASITGIAGANSAQINLGTVTTAGTINYGINVGAVSGATTNYAIKTAQGSVDITDNSNTVPSLQLTNNTITTLGAGINTTGLINFQSTSLTTGNLVNIQEAANALTTGTLLNVSTTSTGLLGTSTTGKGLLANLDWSPGSATTATGDLFRLVIGTNGTTTGSLFNIVDTTSSIFSVSEVAMTTSLPANFTAAGDTSIAYDINFTNPSASYIKSAAPLTVVSGETFNSSNLQLQTYNQGTIVLNTANTTTTSADLTNSLLNTGIGLNIATSALTTGQSLSITTGGATALTSGSGILITGPTGAAAISNTSGLLKIITSGALTSTSGSGTHLDIIGDSTITATLASISDSSIMTGAGQLLSLTAAAATTTTTGLFNINAAGLSSGAAAVINVNGSAVLTTGNAIKVVGPTGAANMNATTGLVNITSTGAITNTTAGAASGSLFQINGNGAISPTLASISDTSIMLTTGKLLDLTANAATTTTGLLTMNATGITTGSALNIVGSTSTGVTSGTSSGFVKIASDVGSGGVSGGLVYLAPDFSSTSAIGSNGLKIAGTDATNTANQNFNINSVLTLTGNAAKVGYAVYGNITDNSTTASGGGFGDGTSGVYAGAFITSDTGVVTTGTDNTYGVFGSATRTGSTTGGTINTVGGYFTATGDTGGAGTTTVYGVYASASGGDTNYPYYSNVAFPNDGSTAALCWDNSGASAILDCTTPLADYAEDYSVETDVDYGEIVVVGNNKVTSSHVETDTNGNALPKTNMTVSQLAKSNSAYQSGIIGITSRNYADFSSTGHGSIRPEDNPMPVALSGRVPLKVSTENGPIKAGDYITSSTVKGVGMKATRPGRVVGKALEDYAGTGVGKVFTFVNVTYADPTDALANLLIGTDGQLLTSDFKAEKITVSADINVAGMVKAGGVSIDASSINRVGALASIPISPDNKVSLADIVNSLTSQTSQTSQTLSQLQDNVASQSAQLAQATVLGQEAVAHAQTLDEKVASTSAHLTGLSQQIQDLLATLSDPEATASSSPTSPTSLTSPNLLIATDSATLAKLDVTEKLSTLNLSALDATVSATFKSLGNTFLGNTVVAGDFSIDGTLSLTGNSLNSLPTLNFQTSPLAQGVDFFNGKITIDKTGQIATQSLALGEQSLGEAIIPAGQTEVIINTPLTSPTSHIFLTPTSAITGSLYVGQKTTGLSFKVKLSEPNLYDVKFNWLIVQSKEAGN